MALNTNNTRPIQIDNEELPYTDRFTYLSSIISRDGGTDLDIQSRLNKVRHSLDMMNKVWHSSTYSTRTKLKLYHSCVLSTLLYGSECWRLTEKDLSKLSTFHTKSLRRILRIFWPNVISNRDLFERCGTEPMATILIRRRWRWIGHVTRQEASINCFALDARRETQEAPPQDHVVTGQWRKKSRRGEDQGWHQSYGKGSADEEGARCCPTCHLGVKGMSEWVSLGYSYECDWVWLAVQTEQI